MDLISRTCQRHCADKWQIKAAFHMSLTFHPILTLPAIHTNAYQ